MPRMFHLFTAILILFASCVSIPVVTANAQDSNQQNNSAAKSEQPSPAKEQQKPQSVIAEQIAHWNGTLVSNEQALIRPGITDEELIQKAAETITLRIEAREQELIQEPEVNRIKAQLEQLGPAPKEGEPAEAPSIAAQRKELETKYTTLDGDLKAIRLIIVRATQIESQITEIRRQHFVTRLSQRYHNLFAPELWKNYWNGVQGFSRSLKLLFTDSIKAMTTKLEGKQPAVIMMLAGLLFTLYCFIALRRRLQQRREKIAHFAKNYPMGNDAKILIATVVFFRNGVVPVLAIIVTYFLLQIPEFLTNRLNSLVYYFLFAQAAVILALVIARLFLAPRNPSRRFIAVNDTTAQKVSTIIIFGVLIIAALWIYNRLAIILVSPFDVSITLRALMALACIITVGLALTTIASGKKSEPDAAPLNQNFLRWGYLKPIFWIGIIAVSIALIAGYLAFAVFLAWQLLITALVFAILWLAIEFIDIYRDQYLNVDNGKLRRQSSTFGFSQQTMLQSGVFGFGLLKLLAIFAAVVIFLISWGYRTKDWMGTAETFFFGFRIGGLNISISSIFLAVILFSAGYFITRAIQNWLKVQFLPTTNLDPGLRNSIATIFSYVGIIIAALLAVSAAGLDLSNIAIIAGALSVGIGFGLQSIVNNFTSGLILLAERPIKAGDWIVTSGGQGIVTKTSVRSTEIETFDGATVIIPNSTLITEAVTNWTHHDKRGRIIITIGVGYNSDPDQVREILLECAKSHKLVLKKPGPKVYFIDFGADALIFEVRGYLSDINNSLTVRSDLRFSIISALREADIEIPYPQRDIHIRSLPEEPISLENKPAKKRSSG